MSAAAWKPLRGKVAIVTASTDGIGLGIARKLARDGAKVMVSSRRQENVDKTVKDLREEVPDTEVEGTVCHVGKSQHRKDLVKETISKFGSLDILVSNAAVNPTYGPTLDTEDAVWDKIFDINVKSAALLVKEALPHLKANRKGSVIFVSSIGGYQPFPALGPYSVSKTALFGLTKALASELAPENIRVNCIAPGIIKTKFSSALWSNEAVRNELLKFIPLGRIGEPEDCAGVVSFLCSDDAQYMTGETITIAGGMNCRL